MFHLARRENSRRQVGPALKALNVFLRWLIPAEENRPRRQMLLLGDRIQGAALDMLERLIEAA